MSRSHGGSRKGAGRTPTNLRNLDISDIGIEIDEPVEFVADIEIHKCGKCGAMWWDEYWVNAKALDPLTDADGVMYPILADAEMGGKNEKHLKWCKYA